MHLAMLSVTLKVPTRQLEALENDQYDAFKGVAFVRAVAQAVCRHLGIDSAPVLAGLPQTVSAWMPVTAASPEVPARTVIPAAHKQRSKAMAAPVWMAGGLMLAGSAAFIWWPARTPSASVANTAAVVQTQQSLANLDESRPAPVPESVAASVVLAPAVAEKALVGTSPAAAFPAVQPSAATASVQAASTVPVHSQGKSLLIAASGETWLEVRDAKGQIAINRLLKAGESQSVELQAPFSVVLGHAQMAKVTLGGKDFDLTPHTKITVARFDILP